MMRKPLVVKKKYAVIQIWRRGGGFDISESPSYETYETVNWFPAKRYALKYFDSEPQGQTAEDGECNRALVQVLKSFA